MEALGGGSVGVPGEQMLGSRQHPGFFLLPWFHYLLFLLKVLTFQASLPLAKGGGVGGEEGLGRNLLV